MYKRKTINYRLHGQIDLSERLAIETGLCCGESFKRIAKKLGRHPSTIAHEVLANRKEVLDAYYGEILGNPKAALIKRLDRCNNVTTMSWGLSRERIYRTIRETEEYYPALLDVLKKEEEHNNAAWLLKYQIESMLDIYKRLM